jgi:Tol biopolymer transport system component
MGSMGPVPRLMLLVALAAGCGSQEDPLSPAPAAPPLTSTAPFLVSNAVGGGTGGSAVYLSLPPGTVPGGSQVSIRVERTGSLVLAELSNGGLDPVAVPAIGGDTLSLIVSRSDSTTQTLRFVVSLRAKPPVIVRTQPEKNRRDVPLNIRIQVVFTEPIDPGSLDENFVLRTAVGGARVAGQLSFADPSHTTVEFVPATELAAETEYEVALGAGIRNTQGTPLGETASIPFATVPPPPPAVAPGVLNVITVTTGIDRAPPGFEISVDGGAPQAVELNGSLTVSGLSAGTHQVRLDGLRGLCSLFGAASQSVELTAAAGASVQFAIQCPAEAVTQLAFVRDGQIYQINSDGTGLVQLTHLAPSGGGVLWPQRPAWSPDGGRIAFVVYNDNQEDPNAVYVMNADGSNLLGLSNGGPDVWASDDPTWSPDGHTILFSSYRPDAWGLFTVPSHRPQEPTLLAFEQRAFYLAPAWSPDASKIVFTRQAFWGQVEDLYVMNADGSDLRPLAAGSLSGPVMRYRDAAWSPDGREIAVAVCREANWCEPQELAVMNADGSGLRVLARSDKVRKPTWSPDGKTIAFESLSCGVITCRFSIRLARVDGSGDSELVTGYSPSWRP